MARLQWHVKHAFDLFAALLLLLVVVPLMALIAILIKADDGGPVFFVQKRPGRNGTLFGIVKFRTMVADADRLLDEQGRPTQDRVTRVGRALRRTSLDELPQLFNIIRGEMSFIGPRPAIVEHLPRYTERQVGRLRVRPGITGLAQVSGRNSLRWSERIELDNEYIDTYSLALDAQILLKTIRVVLSATGQSIDRNTEHVDDLAPGPVRPEETA